MARVLRRPEVAEDVASIWEYIADDNVTAADRWINQINERLQLLATQPLMGHAREELMPGMRSFPFGRYVIFYMPIEDGIDVIRLLHSARDIDSAFDEMP